MVQFKIDKLPELHIVDRYLSACKPLGLRNDERPEIVMQVDDEVVVLRLEPVHAFREAVTEQVHPVYVWIVGYDSIIGFLGQEMHFCIQLLFEASDHGSGEYYITYRREPYDEYFHSVDLVFEVLHRLMYIECSA